MYYIEINFADEIVTLVCTKNEDEVLQYLRDNREDLKATLRILQNAKVFVVHLGSDSAAWEVEFD